MKFVDAVLKFFSLISKLISDGFNFLIQIILSLFQGIFSLLDFVFYFITQAFVVVVLTIKIFLALFQYLFVITGMFFKSIGSMIIPHFEPYVLPETSNYGISAFLQFIEPVGLLTIVPFALSCFAWFFFVKKVISLFGGVRD